MSCSMENVEKPAEHLQITAVKEGNHTHAADDINQCVSQIKCLCQWQLVNHYPRILNYHHSAGGSQ